MTRTGATGSSANFQPLKTFGDYSYLMGKVKCLKLWFFHGPKWLSEKKSIHVCCLIVGFSFTFADWEDFKVSIFARLNQQETTKMQE